MNILVLCTYPVNNPKHGGQLRVNNIANTYRAAGHTVQVAGVLGSAHYECEEGFVKYPNFSQLTLVISNPLLMEDYCIGLLFSKNDHLHESLSRSIRMVPDIVHIEQPWLFEFAKKCYSRNSLIPKFIYGSQNIEWKLKQEIIASYFDPCTALKSSQLIKEVEFNAISNADAVVCVSENDAKWLRAHTSKPVVLAPNGVKAWQATQAGKIEALKITDGNRFALYCASGHPPNIKGFFDMFGGGFGSLKPDEKLVVAGGAGLAIASDARVHQSAKLAEKVVLAGIVTQPCLEGLLDAAHCIVLPLTQGGGTNLKTAEALWSGQHIIASTVAMRGFERFMCSNGVHIANDSKEFKRSLRKVMSSPPLTLTQDEINARRSVLWENCLVPLNNLLVSLNEGGES